MPDVQTGLAPARSKTAWPIALWRPLPGFSIWCSPVNPRYDIDGGSRIVDGMSAALDALDMIRSLAEGPRVLVAHALPAEGPVWDTLDALREKGLIALDPIVTWERAVLERAAAPDATAYLSTFLSSGQRKALRRKRRALEEAGPLLLVTGHSSVEIAAGFDLFVQLEARGWKGRDGTALANDPAGLSYVRTAMLAGTDVEKPFTAALMRNGEAIAAGLFLRRGGDVAFWKTTYAETLAKQSPGVVFDVLLTEWLYEQPWFQRLDAGHDDSVDPDTLVWKQRRRMATVVINAGPRSAKSRAVLAALRLRQQLRVWKNRSRA